MKSRDWLIILIMMIFALIYFGVFSHIALSNDYTITHYGQGVVSIEHDGVIHVMGKGVAETAVDKKENSYNSGAEKTDLQEAERSEAAGYYLNAYDFYIKLGNTEKAREMAYKDIERDLAKTPPRYADASFVASKYLKDKDLAMEYYGKHLEQHANN